MDEYLLWQFSRNLVYALCGRRVVTFAFVVAVNHTVKEVPKLSLYYFPSCPYCVRVTNILGELPFPVELRNIHRNSTFSKELMAARGRTTVPVLRVDDPDELMETRWMPESLDILAFLRRLSATHQ